MKLYRVKDAYLDYLRAIEPKIPQQQKGSNTKIRPFVGIVLTINSVNYIAPLSSQKHNSRPDFKVYIGNKQVATVRTSYMFPVPLNQLEEIDLSRELRNDKKYAALLINEINYIKQEDNKNKLVQLADKTYEYAISRRFNYENFCCNFLLLEQKLKEFEHS